MPKVEIYFAAMCWACHEAMDYFEGRGVAFQTHEVKWGGADWEDSANAREMKRRCGNVDTVPQILVNDKPIGGWEALSKLIESGGIEEVLGGEQG